jgi:CheY-like chemotaxis protein
MARILVVDDEPPLRDLLAECLAEEGHTVLTTADGLAALDLLAKHTMDLVLTDVMMPRLDGFGLVRQLRAAPRLRSIPVILMSAVANQAAPDLDEVSVLTKPFDLDTLLRTVEAGLGNRPRFTDENQGEQ